MLGILRYVRDLTRTQPSCLGCWLDDGGYLHDPIVYAEQWESEEALYHHVASDLYARLLVAMELSSVSPEVHFYFAERSKGIELIEEIRTSRNTEPVTRS